MDFFCTGIIILVYCKTVGIAFKEIANAHESFISERI